MSSSKRMRILFDSAYLLPIVRDKTVQYTGILRESNLTTGSLAIKKEFHQINPSLHSWLKSLELRSKGYKDLIDLLLYTTSLTYNILFPTRGNKLNDFLKENNKDMSTIIHEKNLLLNSVTSRKYFKGYYLG